MKRVLILTNYFLPGHKGGGPIRSVSAMIDRLNQVIDFTIITADRDLGENRAYSDISVNKWIKKSKYRIIYLSPEYLRFSRLIKLLKSFSDYDIIHLNSFFNYDFSILIVLFKRLHILNKEIVLCPRGEFNDGALAVKSAKKKLFIRFSKYFGFYRNVKWHATTDIEAMSIKRIFGENANISIAEALMDAKPTPDFPITKCKGELKLIFLARISPLKNLDFLLEMLLEFDLKYGDKLILNIYGPPEDKKLLDRCERMIKELNERQGFSVNYNGDLQYEKVQETIMKHHFFVLPTKGENFGQAIADALVAGCPVIISDKTPWKNLAKEEVGWDLELKVDVFKECIKQCLEIENKEYQHMRYKAKQYAVKKAENVELIERYVKLFY